MKKTVLFSLLILSVFCYSVTIENQKSQSNLNELSRLELDEEMDTPINPIMYENKIYYANPSTNSVTILNLKGEMLKCLDTKGKGPGEFLMPTTVYVNSKTNELCVVDQMNQRTSIFDLAGNYLRDDLFKSMNIVMDKVDFNGKQLTLEMRIEVDKDKQSVIAKPTLILEEKILFQSEFNPMQTSKASESYPQYTVLKDKLFITKSSKENYEIDVYDDSGEKLNTISKDVKKIKMNKKEILKAKIVINEMLRNVPENAKKMFDFSDFDYKSIIENITNNGTNLWVKTRDENGMFFDVISPDGVLQKQIKIDESGYYLFSNKKIVKLEGNSDSGIFFIEYQN